MDDFSGGIDRRRIVPIPYMENTGLNRQVHRIVPYLPIPCPAVKPTAWRTVAPESGDECAVPRIPRKERTFPPAPFSLHDAQIMHYPRNALPGVAPVCFPSSTTTTPFTITV